LTRIGGLALLLLPVLSGCAVNGSGTVAAHATTADESVVVDLYALGAQLRTRGDDPGLGIGLARRSYVFAAGGAPELTPGWHYVHVPLPERSALAIYHAQLGLDIYREPDRIGATLGLRSGMRIAPISADQTAVIELDYEPGAPERTRVRSCLGEAQCADYFSRR
jgi:hypothetical protein